MQPDPQSIPTPVPKTDPPSLRKPLRLALLRAAGLALRASSPRPDGTPSPAGVAPASQNSAPRILLIRPDHLGDVLFMTPALRLLRQELPGAHLTALVGPWAKPALARNPQLDDLQTMVFPGFNRSLKTSPFAPYRLLWFAARRLRAQRFDTAVILRFDHWWGALLAALAGIPRRIGYDVPEVRPFINDVVHYEPGRHEVLQNVRLVSRAARRAEPALASPAALPLEFHPSPHAAAYVESWLRSKGIGTESAEPASSAGTASSSPDFAAGIAAPANMPDTGVVRPRERFALLAPGSGALVKLWREDGFARVAEALDARGLKVVIAGAGEAERALARHIAALSRVPIISASGETTFEQLAALFERAALVVGVDSGPMHLAVAMRTPSVNLFGPVSAQTFGPWGDETGGATDSSPGSGDAELGARPVRHIVLTSGLACIACNRLDYDAAELPAHPCVRLIADRQVLAAIDAIMPML